MRWDGMGIATPMVVDAYPPLRTVPASAVRTQPCVGSPYIFLTLFLLSSPLLLHSTVCPRIDIHKKGAIAFKHGDLHVHIKHMDQLNNHQQ